MRCVRIASGMLASVLLVAALVIPVYSGTSRCGLGIQVLLTGSAPSGFVPEAGLTNEQSWAFCRAKAIDRSLVGAVPLIAIACIAGVKLLLSRRRVGNQVLSAVGSFSERHRV